MHARRASLSAERRSMASLRRLLTLPLRTERHHRGDERLIWPWHSRLPVGHLGINEALSIGPGPPGRNRAWNRGLRDADFLSAALERAGSGNRLARPHLCGAR